MNCDTMIKNLLKYEDEENSLLDDTNFGISQSEYIFNPISEIIREQMIDICSIWIEIGVPKSRMINRVEEIKNLATEQCIDLFKTIEITEKRTLEELKEYRVSKLQDINTILNDLRLPLFEIPRNISLVETAKLLHYKFIELNNLKKERINKWTELNSLVSQLYILLSCENKSHNLDTGIPSEEELSNLKSHVLELTKLKEQRFKELENYKQKFKYLFVELEYIPETDFEKIIFEDKKFILSKQNMQQLHKLLNKLNKLIEQNQLEMKKNLEKLNSLWKKLSIPEFDQKSCLDLFKDAKPSTLNLMKEEINKLEEIKKQNIGTFIQKIQIELEELWSKCCISHEEIAEFKECYFFEIDLDEKLLMIYENELERLQNFYFDNEDIFIKCAKWKLHKSRLQELEIKSKDPNRYNNRGGALLQEEKERKHLQKGISRLEIEIKNFDREWSNKNNKQFTIYGKPIEQYLNDCNGTCNLQKENERIRKKLITKKELEFENRVLKNSTVANLTKKQTPLKQLTPIKSLLGTKEKKNRIELVSSVGKYNPISISKQKKDILKVSNRKNLVKNLKLDLLSNLNSSVNINKELVPNIEPSLLNESQFQTGILTKKDVFNSTNVMNF